MKINLGCGEDYKEGWHNVDVRSEVEADEHRDLDDWPWPWDDNEYSHALLDNVLEHLENPTAALVECHRIVGEGGIVEVACPHHCNPGAYRSDHRATLHPSEFAGHHYLWRDRYRLLSVGANTVRVGKPLPARAALWCADTFGVFAVDEWRVRLEVLK